MSEILVKKQYRHGFRCEACGQVDVYDSIFATPRHCGFEMRDLGVKVQSGDPNVIEIALLSIHRDRLPSGWTATEKDWPSWWLEAWELWRFSDGRNRGERVGWLGKTKTMLIGTDKWEFVMVPGCHVKEGTARTRTECVAQMWGIINAG